MILRKTAAAIKANLTDLRKWAKTVNQLAKTQAEQIGEMSKKTEHGQSGGFIIDNQYFIGSPYFGYD